MENKYKFFFIKQGMGRAFIAIDLEIKIPYIMTPEVGEKKFPNQHWEETTQEKLREFLDELKAK